MNKMSRCRTASHNFLPNIPPSIGLSRLQLHMRDKSYPNCESINYTRKTILAFKSESNKQCVIGNPICVFLPHNVETETESRMHERLRNIIRITSHHINESTHMVLSGTFQNSTTVFYPQFFPNKN